MFRLPVERLKIEATARVERNTLIFEQGALEGRSHAVPTADPTLGVDHPVPGQLLRATPKGVSNPASSDACIGHKSDASWRWDQGRDSAIGHDATFGYLSYDFENRRAVGLAILRLMAIEYQVPQSRM